MTGWFERFSARFCGAALGLPANRDGIAAIVGVFEHGLRGSGSEIPQMPRSVSPVPSRRPGLSPAYLAGVYPIGACAPWPLAIHLQR